MEQLTVSFVKICELQSMVCDDLEAIADGLPDSVDTQFVLMTAQRLLATMRRAHDFEEGVLFPVLELNMPHLSATLERLRFEHWGDEEFAADIHQALREYVRLGDKAKVDSLAWMLRGFFDGLRRHIAFDREVLLSKINQIKASPTINFGQV